MAFFKLLLLRIVIIGVVAVYPAYAILSLHSPEGPVAPSVLVVIGAFLIALGGIGYFWCVWDFAFVGHGTEPNVLVARGAYKLVRNPMYLSLLVILLGEGLLFGSWRLVGCAATMWLLVHFLVTLYEERALAKRFGSSYEQYCKRVPRWIPRLPALKLGRRWVSPGTQQTSRRPNPESD